MVRISEKCVIIHNMLIRMVNLGETDEKGDDECDLVLKIMEEEMELAEEKGFDGVVVSGDGAEQVVEDSGLLGGSKEGGLIEFKMFREF